MSLKTPIFSLLVILVAGAFSLAVASGGGTSGDSSQSSAASSARPTDPDYEKAEKAIGAKDWATAIDHLVRVVARDAKNADAYNYLGFAERNRGNLDAAFQYYERALSLDPKHLGVREYLGETYLLTGNLPKAEEQLAALDKLCFFSCSEYRELKEKITDYKEKHPHADRPG